MLENNEKWNRKETTFVRKMETDARVRSRKALAITLSLIMVLAAFLSITMFTNTSTAQTQIPTYNGWKGYEGNQSIYLTTYISDTSQSNFPSNSYGSLGVQPSGVLTTKNAVSVGVGGTVSTTNGNKLGYNEYYYSPGEQMVILIPVTAVGTSNWTYTVSPSDQGGTTITTTSGIDYEQLSLNISKAYPSAVTTPYTGYTDGINVSSSYVVGTNGSQFAWNTVSYLLGLLPDGIGQVIGSLEYEHSLYGQIQNNPNSQYVGVGNDTNAKYGMDFMQTETGNSSPDSWGYDTYGITTMYELTIKSSNFLNASKLTVGAQNVEKVVSNGVPVTNNGAYSSVQVNVTPAYTITGTAYVNGAHVGNNTRLLLESSSANYYIYTNSSGRYRFFAQPGVNYFLTIPSAKIGGIQIYPSSTDTSGGNYDLNLTTLTFSESGLSGQTWSVALSGLITPSGNQQTYSSSTSVTSMTFEVESNEIYGWSVSTPNGYTVSPSSGNVNVGANPTTVSVTYTKTPSTYTVTFHESGLPSGTQWSATLNGNTKSSTSSSVSFYSVSDGSYSWSIPIVYYSTTLWYEPSSGSGTVTVSGSSASVSVSFIGVQQNPNSCVYAQAPVLLSNYSTQYAQNITTGESIMTYNFSTHSVQAGTVQAVYVTHHSSMYVINGYLKVAGDQDIWTNHGYIQAQNLTNNDTIFNVFTQHFNKVHSISVEHGNFTMYDFYVTGNHNYVVWWNLMQDRLP